MTKDDLNLFFLLILLYRLFLRPVPTFAEQQTKAIKRNNFFLLVEFSLKQNPDVTSIRIDTCLVLCSDNYFFGFIIVIVTL